MLAEMAEAEVNAAAVNPTGTLRVTSSLSFAMMHIAPGLPEFSERYPNLAVQIVTANRYPDFIEAGIDVRFARGSTRAIRALRYANWRIPDACLRRRLGTSRRTANPRPRKRCTSIECWSTTSPRDPYVLHLTRGAESRSIGITSMLEANDGQVIRAAALAGPGILIQLLYIIYDDIVAGRLIPILSDWQLPRLTINLAYQSRRHQPAKIRVFTEFLIERFAKLELEAKWAGELG